MATGFPLYTYPTIPGLASLNGAIQEMNAGVKQLVSVDTGCLNMLTSIDQKVTRIADAVAPIPDVPLPIPANLFPITVTRGAQDTTVLADDLIHATAPIAVTQSSGPTMIFTIAVSKITNEVRFNVMAVENHPTFSILSSFPDLDEWSVYYIFIPSGVSIVSISINFNGVANARQNIASVGTRWSAFTYDYDTIYNWSKINYATSAFFPLSDNTHYAVNSQMYTVPDVFSLGEMQLVTPGLTTAVPNGSTIICTYLLINPTRVRFNTLLRFADGSDIVYPFYNSGGDITTYVKYVIVPGKVTNITAPGIQGAAGVLRTYSRTNVFSSVTNEALFGNLGSLSAISPSYDKTKFIDL